MRKYVYSSVVQIHSQNISISLYCHKQGKQVFTGCMSRQLHFLSVPETGLQILSKDA